MAKESFTLPGERIASIEEFVGADGTYESNGVIRASRMGKAVFDLKSRTVKIGRMPRSAGLPRVGDSVIGFVENMGGSIVGVKILYINDQKSEARLGAISVSRGGRGRRVVMFRVGDVVRGRVVSLLNSQIHLSFREPNLGVIYTVCHSCGGNVVRVNSSVKCAECGTKDERKLAEDYGKTSTLFPQYQGS